MNIAILEAAIFAQMQATLPVAMGGPFKRVDRYLGKRGDQRTHTDNFSVLPAALLAVEGRAPHAPDLSVVRGKYASVQEVTFGLYVSHSDLRGDPAAASPFYALLDAAEAALSGLVVDGLWMGGRVDFARGGWEIAQRGIYVWRDELRARFELPAVEPADTSVALTLLHGDVNLEGQPDPAPNPVDQFEADTT